MSDPPPQPGPHDRPDGRLLTPVFKRLLIFHLAIGFATSVFLLLPKYFAGTLHAGATAIGLVMATSGVANVFSARPLRHLVGRLGNRQVLRFGSLALAAGGLCFVFVDRVGPLALLARLLQGCGWACVFTGGSTMAANLAPPGRMAQAIGLFAGALLSANAMGPALAEWLLTFSPPQLVWLVGVGFALLAYLVGTSLPDGDAVAASPRATAQALPPSPNAAAASMRPGYFLLWAGMGIASGTVFAFHQPFALERGFSRVSGFLIGFTCAALVVRVLSGQLLDRLGHRRIAGTMLCSYGVMMIAMNWLGPIDLVVLGVGVGLSHGSFYPAMMALCVAQASPAERTGIVAQVNVGSHLGGVCVMFLGPIAARWGYATVFVLVGAFTAIAASVLMIRRAPVMPDRAPAPTG